MLSCHLLENNTNRYAALGYLWYARPHPTPWPRSGALIPWTTCIVAYRAGWAIGLYLAFSSGYVDLQPITNYPSDSQMTSRLLSSIELKQGTQSAEFRLLPTCLEKYNVKGSETLAMLSQGSSFSSQLPSGTRCLSTNFRFLVKYQKLWPVFDLCHFLHLLSLEFGIPVPVQILWLMLNICSQETILFPEYKWTIAYFLINNAFWI